MLNNLSRRSSGVHRTVLDSVRLPSIVRLNGRRQCTDDQTGLRGRRSGNAIMRNIFHRMFLIAALQGGLLGCAIERADAPAASRPGRDGTDSQAPHRAEVAGFELPVLWEYSAPLITPEKRSSNPSHAQKDPTVVFYGGKWHVFMTVKLKGRTAIEYVSFEHWEDADRSPRTLLELSDGRYVGAPQVFYFSPHKKWYLIYQMRVPGRKFMWVAYSTTTDISDPDSWTPAKAILDGGPNDPRKAGGLDYWIICDNERAYLFLTSLNGKMWRLWTHLKDFPAGFGHFELALEAGIFEASHTYLLEGLNKYLTIGEENGRRYFKAYLADRLDGKWTPLADAAEKPFAGWKNIRPSPGVEPWTDNVSHGELVRDGHDQTLSVDPQNLNFVFQGMLDKDKAGKTYGQFPWRIGMLTPVVPAFPR